MKVLTDNEKKGRLITGIFLLGFGVTLLAKKMGVELPWWLFSWQMFLIALGIYIGIKHNFQNISWIILITIGTVFLWDEMADGTNLKPFFWPIMLIAAGLFVIFKPKSFGKNEFWRENKATSSYSIGDGIESINVFSGSKKNIISKDFKGGEVINIMGGTDLNLMQADIKGKILIESINIMGGTKIIMPAHWALHSEVVSIFGGVDDKRLINSDLSSDEKIIVLQGVNVFGGIEIKSY